MRFASIAVRIPSLEVSNHKIIQEVKKANRNLAAEVVDPYLRKLSYLLRQAGSQTRYFRDRNKGETAISLIQSAMMEALHRASLTNSDIDLLIYCGVGRGFLEPGNAYFCAKALQMNCTCFDVMDACMSWVRSLEIAYNYLNSQKYEIIMIVNGEFTAYEYGYPYVFKINSPKQLPYTFPAYTIGEAATAAILLKSQDEWTFDFASDTSLASLCTIPLRGYEEFCDDMDHIGLNGVNGFVSFGNELFEAGMHKLVELAREKVRNLEEPVLWFPHSPSAFPSRKVAKVLDIGQHLFYDKVFPRYGNLVSASIPVGIHMALNDGTLIPGSKVVLCPASAGMTFSVVQFTFNIET